MATNLQARLQHGAVQALSPHLWAVFCWSCVMARVTPRWLARAHSASPSPSHHVHAVPETGTAPACSPLPQLHSGYHQLRGDPPAPPSTQMHPNISTSSQRDTGTSRSPGSQGSRCQPRGCLDTGHVGVPSVPVLSLLALCSLVCPRKGLVMLHTQAPPLARPGAARLLVCPSSTALAGRAGVSRAVDAPIDPAQLRRLLSHRPAN